MVLTTKFLNDIRDNAKTRIDTTFTHCAIGDDDTTPVVGDTTLTSEVFRDSIDDIDSSQTGIVITQLRVLSNEANGETIKEIGWLDSDSGGNLWTHDLINDITKTSDIQLFLDTRIKFTVTEDT